MSLGIVTTTSEGIVLSADSRQTYSNQKGMSRIGSDSASKIFQIGQRVGIIATGLAFLPDENSIKNISIYIDEFKTITKIDRLTVSEIAQKLNDFFVERYNYKQQLELLPTQIEKELKAAGGSHLEIKRMEAHVEFKFQDAEGRPQTGVAGVEQLQFIVAGYNNDGSHQVCLVYVPGEVQTNRDSMVRGKEYGADWVGQTDVLTRIVLGFDYRIELLPFVQKAVNDLGHATIEQQLRGLEYSIQWGTMTLQDALDFSTLAIDTTTALQRFSDGIKANPGDIPGVGGPVDVALITPEHNFVWIKKKYLKIGNKEVDLDKLKANN